MRISTAIVALLSALCLAGCGRGAGQKPIQGLPEAGSLYSFMDGEGGFRVGKVVVVDQVVFVELFKERWPARPKLAEARQATKPTPVAYSPQTIEGMQPVLLEKGSVTPAELDAYEEWKRSNGEVF